MKQADHLAFIEQIDLYLDGELDAAQQASLQAHLDGCARCTRALTLHRQLRRHLGAEPPGVSDGLETRIRRALAGVPGSGRRDRDWSRWGGWTVAAGIALAWILTVHPPGATTRPAPMVRSAIADFQQHIGAPFPQTDLVSLQSMVPFPVAPLPALKPNLIAAWHARIRGQTVGALAYRVQDRIVVEYIVSQSLFFRQATVREAIAREGHYLVHDRGLNVVAWPAPRAGVLLIGAIDRHTLESFQPHPTVF